MTRFIFKLKSKGRGSELISQLSIYQCANARIDVEIVFLLQRKMGYELPGIRLRLNGGKNLFSHLTSTLQIALLPPIFKNY